MGGEVKGERLPFLSLPQGILAAKPIEEDKGTIAREGITQRDCFTGQHKGTIRALTSTMTKSCEDP